MKFWLKIGLGLAALWAVAGGAVLFFRSQQPTAARLTAYVQAADIDALSGEARAARIRRVEDLLNGLGFDDRQEIERTGVVRHFFRSLTPDEQGPFLDATLPRGFQQLMESFNKMDSAKRQEIVNRALREMKEHQGDGPPPGVNDQMAQRVISQGLKSFYRDADAGTKLDLSPLIEQMQLNLRQVQHP